MTLPPQMPSIVNKSTARGEKSHVLTPTRLECCQAWPNLMQATVAGSSWMPQFWGVQKTLFDTSSQPLTYSLFTPFLWWFLNLERKDCGRGVPCVVDHTTNTSSLSLTSIHCTKTLLWWAWKLHCSFGWVTQIERAAWHCVHSGK